MIRFILALAGSLLISAPAWSQTQTVWSGDCSGTGCPSAVPDPGEDPVHFLKWRWEQAAEDRWRDAKAIADAKADAATDTADMARIEAAIRALESKAKQ